MPSQAQLLIDRANALAAGKSGKGNVMPQDWLDIWQQVYGASPEQANQAHGQSSSFYAQNQRAMNETEISGLWERLANPIATNGAPQMPTQLPSPLGPDASAGTPAVPMYDWGGLARHGDPNAAAPRPRGPMVANPATGTATHQNPAQPAQRRAPNPWQINPAVWDSLGNMGQQLAVGFAEDEGWDAGDYVGQINATRPQGQAQRGMQTQWQMPRGWGR